MENLAVFRFYDSLNDFLSSPNKDTQINYRFSGNPAIKDAIEALGIPHTEVDSILVNGSFVNFFHKLANEDVVQVYPLSNITNRTSQSLTPTLHSPVRFIADVPAGKLAKKLRMFGFDTAYQNTFTDEEVVEIAERENRIVLTRDIGLLKHKKIKWGYWLRSQHADEQLAEVAARYHLSKNINPLARCIICNGEIVPVNKKDIIEHLPPKTVELFKEFYQCTGCKKVYWKGSHYEHMLETIQRLKL